MSTESFKRKLSAILNADVAGYGHLTRDDEEATVRTLNTYKEMIFKLIERKHGRLVVLGTLLNFLNYLALTFNHQQSVFPRSSVTMR